MPQQALLAVAIAAAVLAITGCCVAIAVASGSAGRRTRCWPPGRGPGGAARQLCLERLMLGLPSALAGLVLGAVVAELFVPAVTLTVRAARRSVITQFRLWAQALPLALAVAACRCWSRRPSSRAGRTPPPTRAAKAA